MKTNIIYQGDCIEVLKNKVDKKSINLIFADPPYNLSGKGLKWKGSKTGGDWSMVNEKWDIMPESAYNIFTIDWIKECYEVTKDGGSIYVSCSHHNLGEVLIGLKNIGYQINNIIRIIKIVH